MEAIIIERCEPGGSVPVGTRLVVMQSDAPDGWVKVQDVPKEDLEKS